MLNDVLKLGAVRSRLVAKIAGGAQMFAFANATDIMRVGARNAEAITNLLKEMKIPLVAQDVGGTYGRTVSIDLNSGDYTVRTIARGEKQI